ncbi:MAG TPA: hypothetical protein VMS18_05415 [Candidatus Binatia bacterium]|nr:hypothetical protein [Candidatus Binatia bacterium]
MRPSISAAFAVFNSLAVALFLSVSAPAQINGAPASVTSPGFGGRPVNGPPASVTSLGPRGYTPPPRPGTIPSNGIHHGGHDGHHGGGNGDGHSHQRDNSNFSGPIWYGVPVPYDQGYSGYAPDQDQPDDSAENDADYQGGPTVFDRRGQGERSYVPPMRDAAPAHFAERTEREAPAVDPDPPLPPTLLVFKDGRTVEIGNYAIQGSTLFDLTPGHRRKILIADLDLDATRKQNDERGITFQLPQSTRTN